MLVSVIIPVYNRRLMVQEAVASVLEQDFQDYEIIIVEDGSDNLQSMFRPEVMKETVRYYYRPHKGVSAARNFGATVANGHYLAFLDSDDLWTKNKLSKQMEFFKRNPDYRACYTNERWYLRGEHLNQKEKHKKYHGWIFDKCIPLCIISASSIVMEKKVFNDLGGFDETLPACEDYDLWLRLALKYPIAYLNEPLVIKRGGRDDQLSKKYWGMDRWRIKALEKVLRMGLSEEQQERVIEEIVRKYDVLINGAWKRSNYWRWAFYRFKKWRSLGL
jgi:glycosyltransferase involved in cell wall biosynthesis